MTRTPHDAVCVCGHQFQWHAGFHATERGRCSRCECRNFQLATLPAAQVIAEGLAEHRANVELQRRVLDFKTAPKKVDIDYDGMPLFGKAQRSLFE